MLQLDTDVVTSRSLLLIIAFDWECEPVSGSDLEAVVSLKPVHYSLGACKMSAWTCVQRLKRPT